MEGFKIVIVSDKEWRQGWKGAWQTDTSFIG